ncbi:MAG: hypothetical protein L6Q84_24190 [Polyangiaceae bacterium]|nr:hypothetical protein [Polyangiaceae bacterium]
MNVRELEVPLLTLPQAGANREQHAEQIRLRHLRARDDGLLLRDRQVGPRLVGALGARRLEHIARVRGQQAILDGFVQDELEHELDLLDGLRRKALARVAYRAVLDGATPRDLPALLLHIAAPGLDHRAGE